MVMRIVYREPWPMNRELPSLPSNSLPIPPCACVPMLFPFPCAPSLSPISLAPSSPLSRFSPLCLCPSLSLSFSHSLSFPRSLPPPFPSLCESWTVNCEPWTTNRELRIVNRELRILNREPWTLTRELPSPSLPTPPSVCLCPHALPLWLCPLSPTYISPAPSSPSPLLSNVPVSLSLSLFLPTLSLPPCLFPSLPLSLPPSLSLSRSANREPWTTNRES